MTNDAKEEFEKHNDQYNPLSSTLIDLHQTIWNKIKHKENADLILLRYRDGSE